ncbi:MAG TPA: MarR family transcriptional regulator [Solirubrobacteraceae bacterium]|nr:MarR family transcriptional regulator [Solirubrobacteraceae bacterium]
MKKDAEHRPATENLRSAAIQMFGAERRLRSRDHSRAGELTHAQVRALATLGREQSMTAGQLAKSADLNPATVTAMLDQLEELNVVQRTRSTEDRRVCNVSLTPEGWQLLERKRAYWNALWKEHFSEFSDRDLEIATAVIEEIGAIYEGLAQR